VIEVDAGRSPSRLSVNKRLPYNGEEPGWWRVRLGERFSVRGFLGECEGYIDAA